jgi:hypothetical protein
VFWIAATVALAAGWLNRDFLIMRYRLGKERRALRQALEFSASHDSANAELAIDVALAAAPDRRQALRAIARIFPNQVWPFQPLLRSGGARDDTAGMLEIMGVLRESSPASPLYRYDWALLSLLSRPAGDWDDPKRALEQLYKSDETDPYYATGYAFALAQGGRAADALAVAETLSPAQRDYPPRLPYLAYVYGRNGRDADVERMRALGRGMAYLPEERKLFFPPSGSSGPMP